MIWSDNQNKIFTTGCVDMDSNCPNRTAHYHMNHIKPYRCRKTCGGCLKKWQNGNLGRCSVIFVFAIFCLSSVVLD